MTIYKHSIKVKQPIPDTGITPPATFWFHPHMELRESEIKNPTKAQLLEMLKFDKWPITEDDVSLFMTVWEAGMPIFPIKQED